MNFKKVNESMEQTWTEVYRYFMEIVNKHFPNQDEIESQIFDLYNEHLGEPAWEMAYDKWCAGEESNEDETLQEAGASWQKQQRWEDELTDIELELEDDNISDRRKAYLNKRRDTLHHKFDKQRNLEKSTETNSANYSVQSVKEPVTVKEDYLDSPEYQIQRYEDEIQELLPQLHDAYMTGMINAKAYAELLHKVYDALIELDYQPELTEGYVSHAELEKLADAIKFTGPTYRGARYPEFNELAINISKLPDNMRPKYYQVSPVGSNIQINYITQEPFDSKDSDKFIAEVQRAIEAILTNIKYTNPVTIMLDVECRDGKDYGSLVYDLDFNKNSDSTEPTQEPLTEDKDPEDLDFVMKQYIADGRVKKISDDTYVVANIYTDEPSNVKLKFDLNWNEYVYTINGEGPYSHSSYEYINSDIREYIMSHQPEEVEEDWDEYDDTWVSDDDVVEQDRMHAALYGGDREYCSFCGSKLRYEDGYSYCPECEPIDPNDYDFEKETVSTDTLRNFTRYDDDM